MRVARTSIGFLTLFLCAAGWLLAQDEKAATKVKGQLPPNWSKIGLTTEQKNRIYTLRADYKVKIDALDAQIKQLKEQEGSELAKVLTADQKAELKKIVAAKSLSEVPEKTEKKGDEKKK